MKSSEVHHEQIRRMIDSVSEEENKPEFMHQWAYSFLFGSVPSRISTSMMQNDLYLVGYCKNCRNTVSALINRSFEAGKAMLTKTDVPRFGCDPLAD